MLWVPVIVLVNALRQTRVMPAPTSVMSLMLPTATDVQAPNDMYKFDEFRTTMGNRHTTARYTTSKLANIHYAKALAEREKRVKIIPVHPGMVATNLHQGATGRFLRPFLYTFGYLLATPVAKGALSQIFTAVSPDAKNGQYYGPIGKEESGSKLAQDRGRQEKLFKYVEEQLAGHVETIQ